MTTYDDAALTIQQKMSEIMITATFNLRKWESNSQAVMDGVDPLKRASSPVVRFELSEPLEDICVSCSLTSEVFQTHYP